MNREVRYDYFLTCLISFLKLRYTSVPEKPGTGVHVQRLLFYLSTWPPNMSSNSVVILC